VFNFGSDFTVDFIEMSLIESDLIESEIFKELAEIFLVKQRHFLLFIGILFLDGLKKGLTIFEGMTVVQKNDFEKRMIGMGCLDLLFRVCFEALVADGLFVIYSVGGKLSKAGRSLTQMGCVH
jgi:hypothetical protein